MRIIVASLVCVSLAGCSGMKLPFGESSGGFSLFKKKVEAPEFPDATPPEGTIRPRARPGDRTLIAVPDGARTVDEFDTTTTEQREEAQAPVEGGRKIGTTIASLGSPTEPGFWLKTPLVKTEQPGRVIYPVTGKMVQVTLQPIDGPATAGSRMSLAALRLLGAPLTGLPEVVVFEN